MKYMAIVLFIMISLNACSDSGAGSQSSDDSPIVEGIYRIGVNGDLLGKIGDKVSDNREDDYLMISQTPNPFDNHLSLVLAVKIKQRVKIRLITALPSAKLSSEIRKKYDVNFKNSGIDRIIADTVMIAGYQQIYLDQDVVSTLPDGLYRVLVQGEFESKMLYTDILKYSGK